MWPDNTIPPSISGPIVAKMFACLLSEVLIISIFPPKDLILSDK